VCFGATVALLDEDERRLGYTIVGEDEADAEHGKVSWISPLARALMDARVGDMVTWRRPSGDAELEIVAITYG
jgi:transcription elongation GreA/GreB family factor